MDKLRSNKLCHDWIHSKRTESDKVAIARGCYWDSTEADAVRTFIQTYCKQTTSHYKAEYGSPVRLLKWQWHLIRELFSWKNPDGSLRYRELICFIPKKNGKSTLVSCLLLYLLLRRPGSLLLSIAVTKKQANIVYGECCRMIRLDDELRSVLTERRTDVAIKNEAENSELLLLSGNPQDKAGHKVDVYVLDELAAFKPTYGREIVDQLKNSTVTKADALKIVISTAQSETYGHVGYEHYQRAKSILAGHTVEVETLPIIYEVPDSEDWKDIANVIKANPSAGHTLPIEDLENDLAIAIANPIEAKRFRMLRCNQWATYSDYVPSHKVSEMSKPVDTKRLATDKVPCRIGVDVSKRFDLTSVTATFKEDNKYTAVTMPFLPNDLAATKAKLDGIPYDRWAGQYCTMTNGDKIDKWEVTDYVIKLCETYNVEGIYYDAYDFDLCADKLREVVSCEVKEVPQTLSVMGEPTAIWEREISQGNVQIEYNPVVIWCYNNVKLKDVEGGIMITKKGNNKRVDCVTSTLIALAGWLDAEPEGCGVYVGII